MFGITDAVYYKYIFNYIKIAIPGYDTITLNTNQIGNVIIEKDFDNDIFPIFKVTLVLTPVQLYTILDNKDSVKFIIRMDKYSYNNNNAQYEKRSVVFNDIFGIYIDDNSVQLDKELYKQTKDITSTNIDIKDMVEPYDFYLFKDSDLEASKHMINNIIKNCSMTDVMTYMLYTSGSKNVLMSRMDNSNNYDEVLLQPMTLLQNIKELNNQYGFYRHGLLFFYDLARTYFINKRGKSTVHGINEYTDVFIYCYTSSTVNSLTSGCEENDVTKRYGINIVLSNINMRSSSDIINQTIGTNSIIVDSIEDKSVEIKPDNKHRGSSSMTVVERGDQCGIENEFIEDELKARISEQSSIFEVSFAGVDMDILTPNKRFTFVFEDNSVQKRVGGTYRLSKIISALSLKGHEYNISSTCIFYRIY